MKVNKCLTPGLVVIQVSEGKQETVSQKFMIKFTFFDNITEKPS